MDVAVSDPVVCVVQPLPPQAMGEKNIAGMLLVACIASLAAGAAAKNFTLPSLPYPTDVFETSIDNATMSIHWNKWVPGTSLWPTAPACWAGAVVGVASSGQLSLILVARKTSTLPLRGIDPC